MQLADTRAIATSQRTDMRARSSSRTSVGIFPQTENWRARARNFHMIDCLVCESACDWECVTNPRDG